MYVLVSDNRAGWTIYHPATQTIWSRRLWTVNHPKHMDCKQLICSGSRLRWVTSVSTLRPWRNGRHFPDDIFKCIFLNEYVWILNTIWLKFVYKGLINNSTQLVQIMTIIWINDDLGWWLKYASFGLNELYHQPQRTIWGSCLFEMPWFHSCATPPAIAIPTSLILSWPT